MNKSNENTNTELVETVDNLNEDVKQLALNLALYLARAKKESQTIDRLEPQFIRLVNTTIKVVQEIAGVIRAANSLEKRTYSPQSDSGLKDQIEVKLSSILDQCTAIVHSLSKEDQPADWSKPVE